jgi:cell fate regulator YaaT (PSP1 superfamily)
MAKQQNLPLNPMKIAGSCGRLLCCLAYEAEPSQKAQEKSIETAKVMAEEDIESLEEASLEEITETKETDKPNNIIENGTENQPPVG